MTLYHTNIDCVKGYVNRQTDMPENPLVGDHIEFVIGPSEKLRCFSLEVIRRSWRNGCLYVELHLPNTYPSSLGFFEKFVKGEI